MCHRNLNYRSCSSRYLKRDKPLCNCRALNILSSSSSNNNIIMLYQTFCILLVVATIDKFVGAQHFVDQPNSPIDQSVSHYNSETLIRQQQVVPTSEENELRQLNHVVDTMSQLLNEEELSEIRLDKDGQVLAPSSDGDRGQPAQVRRAVDNDKIPELMSESAIRQAIEELEKIQQQEKQAEEESKLRPVLAEAPGPKRNNKQQSAFDSLIDEFGDEMLDDQLAAASQDAERLIQRDTTGKSAKINQRELNDRQQRNSYENSSAPPRQAVTESTLVIRHELPQSQQQQRQQQEQSQPQQKANQSVMVPTQSSLFIGQLDSLASELGPALTNDFYNFHAESNGADRGAHVGVSDSPPSANQDQAQYQQSNKQDASSAVPNYQSDLEPAAQTRNAITRDAMPHGPFSQQDPSTIRFESFNQPHNILPQASRPVPTHVDRNEEALVQAFRQQTGANPNDNGQFPTSTLIPLTNPDNFWRPTNNGGGSFHPSELDQHHDRVRSIQQPSLPPLPESRFQSLGVPGQFSQSAPSSRQSQHVHFTGHSFVPGQPQFPGPQQDAQFNTRPRSLSSTTAPMISVLSGSDTSAGNSVSWNPPATINPPAQALFNQQFSTSTQSSPSILSGQSQSFFPPMGRGPPSPLFNSAFNGLPEDAPRPLQDLRQQFPTTTTEFSNIPETTTDNRFFPPPPPPTTTTQRSVRPFMSQPTDERDTADSGPESTTRNIQNNQRYFSTDNLLGPTSTLPPVYSEPPRPQKFDLPTTTTQPTTTTTTLAPSPTAPKNATKKDDMVIYYYYYYDDNKNATVVTKNVSQPLSASMDAAIEADGGVEDTPYMDDPAPLNNPRTNPPSPPKPLTSTLPTVTSTTTTISPPPAPIDNFQVNVKPDSRSKPPGARAQAASTESATRSSFFDREFNDLSGLVANQFPNDQQRTTPGSTNKNSFTNLRQPVQDPASTIAPTPNSLPSASSQRPSNRAQSVNHDTFTNSNRFMATESTSQRIPPSSPTHPSRTDSTPNHLHNTATVVPNAKVQKDLIQSVLHGSQNSQLRQTAPSTPVASSAAHNNRGPLSNASRYGMNNNLLLDPFGLDPAAPATIVHPSHSSTLDNSGNHNRNWSPGTAANSGSTHQFNRKPTAVTEPSAITSPSSTDRNQGLARNTNQHFSSQRNQLPTSGIASGHVTATIPRVTQASSTPSSARSSGFTGSSTQSSVSTPSRQFFPESGNSVSQNGNIDSSLRNTVQTPRLQTSISPSSSPSTPRQQPLPQKSQTTQASTDEFAYNKLISASEETSREPTQRLSMNGRPSTPDGNTGNGFTRSPIQLPPAPTVAPNNNFANEQRSSMITAAQAPSTQSTTSSSSTRLSNALSNLAPALSTNSASTSNEPIVTTVSTSQTTNQVSETTSPQTTVGSTSPPSVSSSTSAPQEVSQPTESSDSSSTTSRRKFGNRNNRFQTRLNSLSASASRSTTSTSTTQAPFVSSTTRRPTTSTTRKSNKQLFAGRRRLSSFTNIENPPLTAASSSNVGSSNTSAIAEVSPSSVAVSSPTFSTSSSTSSSSTSSSSTSTSSSSSSPQSRLRFGNSFTARSRSTTASPVAVQSETSQSTQKPSLFGAQQRTTTKPRLSFLKQNKPTPSSAPEGTSNLAEGTLSIGNSAIDGALPTTEKPTSGETSESFAPEAGSSVSTENELGEKRELSSTSSSSMTPDTTTTVAPPPSSTQESNGRKPKVRPLFASRQRNTSLFGNRRSASNTTTTA